VETEHVQTLKHSDDGRKKRGKQKFSTLQCPKTNLIQQGGEIPGEAAGAGYHTESQTGGHQLFHHFDTLIHDPDINYDFIEIKLVEQIFLRFLETYV
jgi:hypothetical protein